MKQVFCRRALGAVLGAAAEGGRASSSEDPSIGDTHSLGGLRRSFATITGAYVESRRSVRLLIRKRSCRRDLRYLLRRCYTTTIRSLRKRRNEARRNSRS